jgi:hypothetical protein
VCCQATINNLDALDVIIEPNLHQLGRKHTAFHGFHPEHLEAFEAAMEDVWRSELGHARFTVEVQRAWNKIFHLITSKVLEGYQASKAEMRSAVNCTESKTDEVTNKVMQLNGS